MINDKQFRPVPQLETGRLLLREITLDDAAVLHQYWSDREVGRYFVVEPFSLLEETLQMIRVFMFLPDEQLGARWVVIDKAFNKVIGSCGFHNAKVEHSRAEIGYEIGKEYWGRGIMSEAMQAVLNHGFTKLGLNRIEAFVNFGNERSIRILEKNGFSRDGLLRAYEFARGKFVDQYCYSLLKAEFLGIGGPAGKNGRQMG